MRSRSADPRLGPAEPELSKALSGSRPPADHSRGLLDEAHRRDARGGASRRRLLTLGLGSAGTTTPHASGADAALTTRAMRDPSTPRAPESVSPPPTPPLGVLAMTRMGFGPRSGDLDAFALLGATDDERFEAYVAQQLDPNSITDSEFQSRLASANFETLDKSRSQLWIDHIRDNTQGSSYRYLPREESERATLLRMLYSRRQLAEVLADFWHNHFNVYAADYWVGPMFVHYDRDVIRGNMLGNFRQMLGDVARSTAMLYYLDNYTSSNAGPNENFCRELFELHTLGAENYLGIRPQSEVPTENGVPIGYVDADVFEATRAFTGWTVANSDSVGGNTGEFFYRADWHDRFQKTVLGVFLPQDQTDLKDGNDVLDALATHPGTARHIAFKLCRRLIADNPPQAIVDQAAQVFQTQAASPTQLKQVVETILLSTEFRTTWGAKAKRPIETVMSAMRAAEADFTFRLDHSDTNSFFSYLGRTGQPLFYHPAPDGYPDVRAAWQSATPRAMTWRMVNWLIDLDKDDVADTWRLDVLGQTPNFLATANELADYWIERVFFRPLDPAVRQEIVDFMGQGFNPDLDLPWQSDEATSERLRSMVGLLFMIPDFLYR